MEERKRKVDGTRRRSNTESDIDDYKIDYKIENKIEKRSRYDLYFKKQSREFQLCTFEKEDEIEKFEYQEIPLRYRILHSDLSIPIKSIILKKIDIFDEMDPQNGEYMKLMQWIQGISKIPFGKYIKLPIERVDTTDKKSLFLKNAMSILDGTIYGQANAKNKIMHILAQWITNPLSVSSVIALEGPAGVGKTSLVQNGVSKVLERPFFFHALGGASDASVLEGHHYTYEGATWGRILDVIMQSHVMNPILFFDEVDKISANEKGSELSGLLTHVTDTTQNHTFHDKYFSGIPIDLSKILFFFSMNDSRLVHPILKDRMTIVPFEPYSIEEKIEIGLNYIFPKLMENIGIKNVTLSRENIRYMIETYTQEDGVRSMKRHLEEILLEINLQNVLDEDVERNIDIDLQIINDIFKKRK
jgi:ATP-dependent Lon protease